MKIKHFISFIITGAILFAGCKDKIKTDQSSILEVSVSTLNFGAEGGTAEVTLRAGGSWKASTDAGWLSTNPAGGAGSDAAVPVIVEAAANISSARTATITVTSGKNVKKIEVSQEGVVDDGIPRLSIAEFKKKSDSNTDWYRLTGEVVSFEYDNGYGSFYLNDENNDYIYVWRLASDKETAEDCSKKEDKGTVPSDYKFSTLNLKAGDIITIVAHKNTWNKKEEAYRGYFEAKITGNYPGYSAAKASASWLELPQTAGEDAYDYLCHMMKSGGRNYSIYYSKADRLAKWVAYPLYSSYVSSRSDAYAFDPLVGEEDQPALKSSYQNRTHDGEEFIRGHMVPSAERTGRSNLDVFLSTNIMPQSTELNNGSWGELEGMARKWTGRCDTLYVVVGTDMQNTKYKVKDTRGLEVLVPSGIYRAVLAYKKDEGYRAMAVYFNNSKSDASASIKSKAMSVDELEKKVGVDFFVNLPDDVEKEVEAKDPTKDSWWW